MESYQVTAERVVLSQYSHQYMYPDGQWRDTIIKRLGLLFAEYIDPTEDINTLYDNIINPLTALGIEQGQGLADWLRIVGIDKYIEIDDDEVFGFDGSELQPFNQGVFTYGNATKWVELGTPEEYRALIFYKARSNISGSTMPELKQLIKQLLNIETFYFTRATFENLGVMKLRISVYDWDDTKWSNLTTIIGLLRTWGLLNVGAGVGVEYYFLNPNKTFGFKGSEMQPFNQAPFAQYEVTPLNFDPPEVVIPVASCVVKQSANQLITVYCNGDAHTEDFEASTAYTWNATVTADPGYEAGKLSPGTSGAITMGIEFSATPARAIYYCTVANLTTTSTKVTATGLVIAADTTKSVKQYFDDDNLELEWTAASSTDWLYGLNIKYSDGTVESYTHTYDGSCSYIFYESGIGTITIPITKTKYVTSISFTNETH